MLLLQKQGLLCWQVSKAKKLVIVLATSLLLTEASMKDTLWPLEKVLCIYHSFCFQKNLYKIRVLINSSSEINAIILTYIAKLGLKVGKTNIKAQKIDDSTLNTFKMVLVNF